MHLCACVSEEGGDGKGADSETSSLLSYTLRYVSLAELDTLYRVGLRDPMHLCVCVSEEGGDREGTGEGGDSDIKCTIVNKESRKVTHRNKNLLFIMNR